MTDAPGMLDRVRAVAAAFIVEGRTLGEASGVAASARLVESAREKYARELWAAIERLPTDEERWAAAMNMRPFIETLTQIRDALVTAHQERTAEATRAATRARQLLAAVESSAQPGRGGEAAAKAILGALARVRGLAS